CESPTNRDRDAMRRKRSGWMAHRQRCRRIGGNLSALPPCRATTERSFEVSRNRRSAKQAGARFERRIADALAQALDDDRIDRRPRNGSKDRGDIGGVRVHGQRVVIECKDTSTMRLPEWTREAQLVAGNDDALVGVVVHKRRGVGDAMQQWVTRPEERR